MSWQATRSGLVRQDMSTTSRVWYNGIASFWTLHEPRPSQMRTEKW